MLWVIQPNYFQLSLGRGLLVSSLIQILVHLHRPRLMMTHLKKICPHHNEDEVQSDLIKSFIIYFVQFQGDPVVTSGTHFVTLWIDHFIHSFHFDVLPFTFFPFGFPLELFKVDDIHVIFRHNIGYFSLVQKVFVFVCSFSQIVPHK